MKKIIKSPTILLIFVVAVCATFTLFYSSSSVGAQKKRLVAPKIEINKIPDVPKIEQENEQENEQRASQKEQPLAEKSILEELRDWWYGASEQERAESEENNADMPRRSRGLISEEDYLNLRGGYIQRIRGIEPGAPFDISARNRAINTLERQEKLLKEKTLNDGNQPQAPEAGWTEIGPFSIPNGQSQQYPAPTAVTGRTTAVVVDPTDSNIVYIGTAQGGVWRSLNGGTTWTPIFDSAQSLAVGALALAPSDHTILYVGTGESNNSADSFFGVGVYRIDGANGATPALDGPINPTITTGTTTALTYKCFNGRGITRILVHPTDPATIFVSTATGVGGNGASALSSTVPPLALRGVFRSTNATSAAASVTFQKIIVNTDGSLDAPGTGNTSIFDMAFEPGVPNTLLVSTQGASIGGAIYRSTNALAATPTFTRTLFPGYNGLVMHLAVTKVAGIVTVYMTSNEPVAAGIGACNTAGVSGGIRKSVDGGVTWSAILPASAGFCGGQCSYDSPIGVSPTDANIVYIGGNARGTCSDVLKRSSDGGTTFTRDDTGLHADSHYIFFDAQTPISTVWFANDGGIWKRPDAIAGTPWLNQNRSPLSTFQFQSVATHPTDANFTIGGTQDNGTMAQTVSSGNWSGAEGGDGGYALIDQSSTDTTNVTMYHTFYNQAGSQIYFDRANVSSCLAVKDGWETRGIYSGGTTDDPTPSCDGTPFYKQNGIVLSDAVLFYAPMALGPGTPNVLYFGTSRLYRSTDKGDTMTTVSQIPLSGTTNANGSPISTIAISPQDDNYRLVGLQNGKVFATSSGSSTLTDITSASFPANPTGSATNKFVGRAQFDPTNKNVAYVTFSFYAPAGQGIWKVDNIGTSATVANPADGGIAAPNAAPNWTAAGNGIPSVPINAFVIDPQNSNNLYAGTDIGVYASRNGGANWQPFGIGLPRVAVFDMSIQPTSRTLRIATHGRGMWQIPLLAPTAASVMVSGRVLTQNGRGVSNTTVSITDSNGNVRRVISSSFGYYSFSQVEAGQTYTVAVSSKKYRYDSKVISIEDSLQDVDFVASSARN